MAFEGNPDSVAASSLYLSSLLRVPGFSRCQESSRLRHNGCGEEHLGALDGGLDLRGQRGVEAASDPGRVVAAASQARARDVASVGVRVAGSSPVHRPWVCVLPFQHPEGPCIVNKSNRSLEGQLDSGFNTLKTVHQTRRRHLPG